MKTEELAKKYVEDVYLLTNSAIGKTLEQVFIAGYNKAKEWVNVDDDLPEIKDNEYEVICTYRDRDIDDPVHTICLISDLFSKSIFKDVYSHWRYID